MCGSAAERRGRLSRATRNCRGALLYMCVCVAWWLAEMHVRRHNNPIVRARAGAGDGASTSGLARYNRANKKSARKYPNVCVCVVCTRSSAMRACSPSADPANRVGGRKC